MMEDGGVEALLEIETHPACTSPERKQNYEIKIKHEIEHPDSKFDGFSKTNGQSSAGKAKFSTQTAQKK